jgi:hypothetical protein
MPALPYRAGDGPDDDTGGRSLRAAADDLVLVTTPSMRARRHPRAIAAMWAWQAVLALLVSWPTAGLVSSAWSGDPHGDAPLWAPGGHALLDWLWHDSRGLASTVHAAEIVLVVGSIAGLVPMAALMIALGFATRDRNAVGFARCLYGAARLFPSMLLLGVLYGLLQGLVVGVGALLAHGVAAWTHETLGEARSQQLAGVVLVLFLAAASAVGVMHDLARASVVRFKVRGVRGFALGARTFRLAPLSLWWSWAWRALASIAPVLAAAPVAGQLGGRGGFALMFLGLLHQAVVAARVGLRASWLARALRAVDGTLRRSR